MPNSTVCLTFDFDALAVWHAYERTTPAMLLRGEYDARVGVPRVLAFLTQRDVDATFFVPGHSAESFPAQTAAIVEAGHELAHHSYSHIDPSEQTADDERADMERAWKVLERFAGTPPVGYRSPSADLSPSTLTFVEELGVLYDSSLMADDYRPFHPRIGDKSSSFEPLQPGRESRLWELPLSFELDDWVHFQFNFNPYRRGGSTGSQVLEIWTEEFDWMDANVDGGILTVTMHPQVIARGHRMAMLSRFVDHCQAAGARFARMIDVARSLGD